jgi:hypothetical protein
MSHVYCGDTDQMGRTNIWLAGNPKEEMLLCTYQATTP